MLKNFNVYFQDGIEQRIDDISNEIASMNANYKDLTKTVIELAEKFNHEEKKLFEDIMEIVNQRNYLVQGHLYKQGFRDGVEFSRQI